MNKDEKENEEIEEGFRNLHKLDKSERSALLRKASERIDRQILRRRRLALAQKLQLRKARPCSLYKLFGYHLDAD